MGEGSGVVYDLLVGHEVGHALYTPAENWTIDHPDIPMSYVNVLEDVRIEKFETEISWLEVKHFTMDILNLLIKISLNYHQHDINDMGLADRINIHYKIGKFENVSFETDEEYL